MKKFKIAVAGTGYVGLSLSVLLAQHNQVMAVDIVQAKVDILRKAAVMKLGSRFIATLLLVVCCGVTGASIRETSA